MNINEILISAAEKNASDVHISTGHPIAFRINGELSYQTDENLDREEAEDILMEILGKSVIDRERFQQYGEVDMSYSLGENKYRVNIFKKQGAIAAAIRLIPTRIPNILDLGLPINVLDMLDKPKGLVLVTGPTGSGKSTTLASMIDYINKHKKAHIITLEDPIEYVHKHNKSMINQREVGKDTRSFENALKSSLREDPDVIMVGEMRDVETMRIAITAAETGHLVLSTLHTMNAPQTIERIIDVFPAEQQNQVKYQLSMILNGIISQQLVEKMDGSGRVLASEVMMTNSAVSNLIREGKTHQIQNIMQTRLKDGMQTMEGSLMSLYEQKLITKENLIKCSPDEKIVKETMNI